MGDESRFRYRRDEGAAEGGTRSRTAPSAASEGDPLAELARLIGDEDPFDDFHNLPADEAPQAADPRRSATAQRYAPPSSSRAQAPAASYAPAAPRRAPPPPPAHDDYDDGEDGWSDAAPRYAPPEPPARADAARARAPLAAPLAAPPAPRAPTRYEPQAAPSSRAGQQAPAAPSYGSAPSYGQPSSARGAPETEVRSGYGSLSRDTGRASDEDDDYDDRYDDPPARASGAGGHRRDADYDDTDYAPERADARHGARGYASGHGEAEHDEAAYAYSSARRDDDGYDDYDDAYDPEYGDDGYMPPHGEEMYDAEPRRRKGRLALVLGVSVVGLLVAGVAGVFAYNMAVGKSGFSSSGAPPVIKADSSPAKTASPPQPAPDAGQKMIYDRMGAGGTGNERVVSREEQPVDVTAAVGAAAPAAAPPAPAPAAPPPAQVLTEPKKVKTLTVRADGSLTQGVSGTAVSAYAANQNPIPAGLPEPNPVTTVPAAAPPAQSASTSSAPTAAGGYVVQVASQRSEADAMGSWRALQTKYPNLLGNYRATVKKADLGDKGIYYRAQVGPFATRDQANDLCQSLRAQGGDCVVNKN